MHTDKSTQLNQIAIVTLFAILAIIFFSITRFFVVPIILAASFSVLFYPWYCKLNNRLFRNRWPNLAAILTCALIIIVFFVPTYIIIHSVFIQISNNYQSIGMWGQDIVESFNTLQKNLPPFITEAWLKINEQNIQNFIQDILNTTGRIVTTIVNKTSSSAFDFIAGLFLTIFTMFYFFRDGEKLIKWLKKISPLRNKYEEIIIARFNTVTRSTLKSTVIIGLVQGVLGGAVLFVLGFKTWIIWSILMIILSIIPVVGSYFVLVPASIILFIKGQIFGGIFALVAATVINYGIDYLMRPRLVGHDTKIHDLVVFYSTIGGMAVFGIMGFIVGPVLAVLFLTFIDIYFLEYKKDIDKSNSE